MKDSTVDDCDGIFRDSDDEFGGRYGKNEDFTFSICPGLGGTVVLDLAFLNLEAPYDSLTFFNGPDMNSPLLGSYTGQQTPGPTIIATSGCLTVNFVSDGTLQLNGWEGMWQTTAPPVIPPIMTTATANPPACGETDFTIEFDKNVHCDSITLDAFNLTGPSAPTVTAVTPLNCAGDSTMSATLTLSAPFEYNCPYTLDFDLNILDICDSLWMFTLTDNFAFNTCKFPYELNQADTVCLGNCTNLEVTAIAGCSPLTYTWDNGLPATAGPHNVCPTVTTTYRVTITETNSGQQAFDSVTVVVQDPINTNLNMSISSANGPQCGNNTMTVIFYPGMPCFLLDSGVFDLSIPTGTPPTIASFNALNCTNDLVDSVQITLGSAFSGNCTYTLDYNWEFNHKCTGPTNITFTDMFSLTGCPLVGTSNAPDTICENKCDSVEMIVNGCDTYSYSWSNGWPNSPGPHEICPSADTSITVLVTEIGSGQTYSENIFIRVIPLGLDLDFSVSPAGLDCQADSLIVNYVNPVSCNSITDTSFTINGGTTAPIITSVTPINCIGNTTTSVRINFANSFTYNCDYDLNFSLDTVDFCGDPISVLSTDTFRIDDCPLDYRIRYTQKVCKDLCTGITIDQYESCFGYTFSYDNGLPDTNRVVICPDGDTTITLIITENVTGFTSTEVINIEVDSSFTNFSMYLDETRYTPTCDSTKLSVRFSRKIPCDSIYADAFFVRDQDNVDNNVIAVYPQGCNAAGDSVQFVDIEFSFPLDFYGTHRLTYQSKGNECVTYKSINNLRLERHESDFTVTDTCYYAETKFSALIDSLNDLDSVRWDFGEPTSANNTSSNLQENHIYATQGDFDVTLFVYYPCEIDTIIKTITISPPLNVTITGRPSVCEGVGTILDGGAGFASYLWNNGTITRGNNVTTEGLVDVIVSDGSGCRTGRDTLLIDSIPNLQPLITGPLSYCPGTGTTLDAGIYDSYLWNTGINTRTLTTNTPAQYSVIVYDTMGCAGYDTAEVILGANLPTTITGNSAICPNTTTILDAGDNGYVLYQWSTGDTTQSIPNMTAGTYFVYVRDTAGCSGYDTITVTQYPEVDFAITSETSFCLGNYTTLYTTPGFTGYIWNTGVRAEQTNVWLEGEYSVRVLDRNLCFAYDTVFIKTDTCIDTCSVILPNAFTPNEDGLNDIFAPSINRCEFEYFEMRLFDRWGQVVFETKDLEFLWDGLYKDKPSVQDIYIWQIRYKSSNDPREKIRTGHVSLIR